jgi:hypothetical protein
MLCFTVLSFGDFSLHEQRKVTRAASGRAEALAVESDPLAGRERKIAGCASRNEQDPSRATLTRQRAAD